MRVTDLKTATVASIVDPHIDCAQDAFGVRCEVGHAGRAGHIALLPKDLDVWPHLQHKQQEVESACQSRGEDQLLVASEVGREVSTSPVNASLRQGHQHEADSISAAHCRVAFRPAPFPDGSL